MLRLLLFYILFLTIYKAGSSKDFCLVDTDCKISEDGGARYLFYDVNPVEGFNLRRDVYMRFAVLAHELQLSKNRKLNSFKLVLPPWSHLVHWKYSHVPEQLPWGRYFDLASLKSFAPVIEMHEFFTALGSSHWGVHIDEVYILQHFEDMFETNNFEDRMHIEECHKKYELYYFFYKNITSNNVKCLSYHGSATNLKELLLISPAKTILLHHAEVALHEMFGNQLYWQARRSMRFNNDLRKIAQTYRSKYLKSNDESDNTILPLHWQDEKPKRDAKGGPYLAAHLRRKDFVRARPNEVPTLNDIVDQISGLLKKLTLTTVFLATDANNDELEEITHRLSEYKVITYKPNEDVQIYGDGGIAIIDQIICSYARYFIGTLESTFSFRIQEEREILGFPTETTFNAFCRSGTECSQPSVWKIVY